MNDLEVWPEHDGTYYIYNPDTDSITSEGYPTHEEARQFAEKMNAIRRVAEEKSYFEDPETGAKKEIKKAQLGAIDPKALLLLAEAAGYGAGKYEQYNYLKGYPWSLSFNAMMRHALAFWNGEDIDPESGLPHMVHAAWHGLAMTSFLTREIGEDDRFKGE